MWGTAVLKDLARRILSLDGDTRVVMEATGRYHEPIAAQLHENGIFVSVVNPLMISGYSTGGTVRKVKNDEKDARKIAQFALDHWVDLREYTPMDDLRQQLKICSRQYDLYMNANNLHLRWKHLRQKVCFFDVSRQTLVFSAPAVRDQ